MRPSAAVHDALADLLEYPGPDAARLARESSAALREGAPEAADLAARFVEYATAVPVAAWEEAYVRTFDGNVERALETGWQVFGEQYARGVFLVRMRDLLRSCGVRESSELPDHLTHVLRVLGRADAEQARMIAEKAARPSVRRVLADLPADDPYTSLLRAVEAVVEMHAAPGPGDVPAEPVAAAAAGGDA